MKTLVTFLQWIVNCLFNRCYKKIFVFSIIWASIIENFFSFFLVWADMNITISIFVSINCSLCLSDLLLLLVYVPLDVWRQIDSRYKLQIQFSFCLASKQMIELLFHKYFWFLNSEKWISRKWTNIQKKYLNSTLTAVLFHPKANLYFLTSHVKTSFVCWW